MHTIPHASRRTAAAVGVSLLVASTLACAGDGETSGQGTPTTPATSSKRVVPPGDPEDVTTGLEVPWAIGFLPGGDALVPERDSTRIVRVEPGGDTSEVGRVDAAEPSGEGGLLGLAIPPDAGRAPFVYVYYTTGSDNRITRMRYDPEDGLGKEEVLVKGIPSAGFHNGGRLAFGPDGHLYATTGDAGQGERAQDTGSLGGKILRMTKDGEPAKGNPFDNLTYSYGHRNVQGLDWDEDGQLFATEFGQDTWDEVNVIERGGNYGWPEVEGVGDDDSYIDPVVTWTTAEASPSGAAIAGGSLWVAALRGERLWRVPLTGDEDDPVAEPEALHVGTYGRLRAVATVPGGDGIWVTSSNKDGRGSPKEGDDRILRIPMGE